MYVLSANLTVIAIMFMIFSKQTYKNKYISQNSLGYLQALDNYTKNPNNKQEYIVLMVPGAFWVSGKEKTDKIISVTQQLDINIPHITREINLN